MKIAERIQRQRDAAHIAQADPRRTEYATGAYVLVEYPSSIIRRGPPNKFLTQLKGPMKVLGHVLDEYTLLNLTTNKEVQEHIKRIHPFRYDSAKTIPDDVARRDYISAFEVEKIIEHTGIVLRRGQMDFRVRFKDLAPKFDRWLPYKEIKANGYAHEYFWNKNLKTLIATTRIQGWKICCLLPDSRTRDGGCQAALSITSIFTP